MPPVIRRAVSPAELGRSQAYFPLVGLLLGLVLAALDWLLGWLFPPPVVNALLVLSLVLLTGALHLDGLMDTCDGLFSHADSQRRLDIMRDSRVGSFGVLGAVTVLLIKYVALVSLPPSLRLGALLAVPTLGRWAMVVALAAFPYARQEGRGTAFKGGVSLGTMLAATLVALAIAILSLRWLGGMGIAAVAVFTWLLGRYILSKLPGLTGDTYGAICETTEVLVLLLIVAIGTF